MLIAVTAPKKGLGQTTTAINLAAMVSKYLKKEKQDGKVLMIDINKFCKDIEYYLSDTTASRGLDDFYNLCSTNLINEESFGSCVKGINENIDIMAANDFYEIDAEQTKKLIELATKLYPFVILDSIAARRVPPAVEEFYDEADVIVVVLNQIKSVTNLFYEKEMFNKYKDKLVFVINKNRDITQTGVMEYNLKTIKKELKEQGYENPIVPLSFDIEVMNQSNFGSILSLVLSETKEKRKYTKELRELARTITADDMEYRTLIKEEEEENETQKSFFEKIFAKK